MGQGAVMVFDHVTTDLVLTGSTVSLTVKWALNLSKTTVTESLKIDFTDILLYFPLKTLKKETSNNFIHIS